MTALPSKQVLQWASQGHRGTEVPKNILEL